VRRSAAAVLALVTAFSGLTVLVAPAALAACPTLITAGPPLPATAGQDPLIQRMGLRRAWELSTGAGVTVSVVDSGVDFRHPKLAGAVDPPADFLSTDGTTFETRPGGPEDCVGHGTAIAGIIAARSAGDDRVLGVAPGARIAPFRFEGDIANAPLAMIAAAIRAAADHSKVMDLSFTAKHDPRIHDAIRYALSRDVVVVAAAGNENQSNPGVTSYPAAYPGVLAVASVDADGRPSAESNRGSWVGIAAPGQELTTLASGGGGYTVVTGTSFATAVVAGTAALVRAKFPNLSAAEVVARLEDTAVSPGEGRDDATGAGIVDPFAALSAVGATAPTVPTVSATAAAGPAVTGDAVRVLPVPVAEPPLTPVGTIALAATTIMLVAAGIAAAAGMTRRRSAARRGVAGAQSRYADAHRPLEPVPDRRLDQPIR
jgi:type VII secretion-associated serine protease mycosin